MKNFKLLQFLNRTNSSSTFDRNSDSTKSPSAPFILPPVHSTNNIRPFSMRYRTTGSRKKSDIPKWITRVEIVQKPSLVSKMAIFRPKMGHLPHGNQHLRPKLKNLETFVTSFSRQLGWRWINYRENATINIWNYINRIFLKSQPRVYICRTS